MFLSKALLISFILYYLLLIIDCKQNVRSNLIEEISDFKDFRQILRTKTNVLVLFVSNKKKASTILSILKEASDDIKGQGTMVLVDCSGDGKKLCKKLKVSPETYSIKHYKDGDFHKDYDRKETVQSVVNFMKDPTGDLPWEEEPSAANVTHLPDPASLQRLIKKETRPIMVMFYAPWCGYCKRMKPNYEAAASEVKNFAVMAAIDVNRPENAAVRTKHNITGFPTLIYFRNGERKYTYDGDNSKDNLIEFMRNPQKKAKQQTRDINWWSPNTDVKELTKENFDSVLQAEPSALVMFYAPWCGYCKRLKPEFEKAATSMKVENVKGLMAAVDATKETELASKYDVTGYPTLVYFTNGVLSHEVNMRQSDKIINFMKSPIQNKQAAIAPEPEKSWTEQASEVVHLKTETFKQELRKKRHSLVMFYAPCTSPVRFMMLNVSAN